MSKTNLTPLEYTLLDDCRSGPAQFFVVASLVDLETEEGVDELLRALAGLVSAGYLALSVESSGYTASLQDLRRYTWDKRSSGQALDERAHGVPELAFVATDAGIDLLEEVDRPVE